MKDTLISGFAIGVAMMTPVVFIAAWIIDILGRVHLLVN